MGLYLCIFASADEDAEVEGVEVGSYEDFHDFRQTIADQLEGGEWGRRFPTLMLHQDSDGSWSPGEAATLEIELREISEALAQRPPSAPAGWQAEVWHQRGTTPRSLRDTFIDVDGEPLLVRLSDLASTAAATGLEISFQ